MRRAIRLLGEAQREAKKWRNAANTWESSARTWMRMFREERENRIWALHLSVQLLEEAERKTGESTEDQRIQLTAMILALEQKPTG